jgi:RNA polymerase sigma-70 factor (family 1)
MCNSSIRFCGQRRKLYIYRTTKTFSLLPVLSSYSDQELIRLLKQDDEGAFTELYNRYWERLLFIAGIKLRNLAIAEELVQDIFLDLWNRREHLEISGELSHYLATSMKYKVINAQAKQKRALDYARNAGSTQDLTGENNYHRLHFEELRRQLALLVADLPEKCRITYQLSRDQGLPAKEIARQLRVSEKAVEANLSRALRALRTGLSHLQILFFFLF